MRGCMFLSVAHRRPGAGSQTLAGLTRESLQSRSQMLLLRTGSWARADGLRGSCSHHTGAAIPHSDGTIGMFLRQKVAHE